MSAATIVTGTWHAGSYPLSKAPYGQTVRVFGADARLGHVRGVEPPELRVTAFLREERILRNGFRWDAWTLSATDDSDRSIWHGMACNPNQAATLHCCSRCPGNHNHEENS